MPTNSGLWVGIVPALAGAEPKLGHVLDGTSITTLLFGDGQVGKRPPRKPIYWHFPGYLGAGKGGWRTTPAGAIRSGDWKLIEFFETGKVELYNLKDDVSEKTDLAAKMPERAKSLRDDLALWRKSVNAPMPEPRKK